MAKPIQVSKANGSAKEKKLGGAFEGFFAKMLIPKSLALQQISEKRNIPRFIKGDVKSTTSSRSAVIVKSVIARSAC